jgi:pyruvate/2-oxoglutarate dehydrogenase complex dihydrolipoamide acyltransferase (E2) component
MSDDLVPVESAAVWPDDAQDVEEAIVANWFVSEGSGVEKGDTIAEIQIEKVSVDVPAPAMGELVERLVSENEEFERGDVLARIESA